MSAAPTSPQTETRSRGRRWLRRIGWTLITAGVLILLFVVWELVGTNFITNRHQDELRQDLARGIPLRPIPGEALGIIRIPEIRLDMVFVEGVSVEALRKGPGHYPKTPYPGEEGNIAIAGHRTTYAKPFWSLDELEQGDTIILFTRAGKFTYEVRWKRVVSPYEVEVLRPTERPSLTLTTCNPRFSAAERLIVRARQVGEVGSAAHLIRGAS
jgi:sortase A